MTARAAVLVASAALVLAGAAAASSPPPFSAKAVIVANGATGEVLYEFNADAGLPMASITKMMTALVVLERARPNEQVVVGKRAARVGEASVNLRSGERLQVQDLLAAILVQSANDAAYALANYVGDGRANRFVALMNTRAAELGLENTRFRRPDGLDAAGHYSSARDILKFARQAMQKPLIRKLVRRRSATIAGGRKLRTTNDLLFSFSGAVGVKTGHTRNAGWSQVAAARRNGATIYVVLLGGPSRGERNTDLAELLEWGFDQYGRVALIRGGHTYAEVEIPFSDDRLPLVAGDSAYRVVRLGASLVERVVAPTVVDLPVKAGDEVGSVCVDHGRQPLCRPLVAGEDIPEPGLLRRLGWYAGRALHHAGAMLKSLLGAIF